MVAVGQPGAGEDPRGALGDHHVGLHRVALVEVADEVALGTAQRRLPPVGGDLGTVGAQERVFGCSLVVDLVTVGAKQRRFEADVSEDGVGAEEGQVDATVARVGRA